MALLRLEPDDAAESTFASLRSESEARTRTTSKQGWEVGVMTKVQDVVGQEEEEEGWRELVSVVQSMRSRLDGREG